MGSSSECSDEWSDEEELRDYRKGGYHPVKIGEEFCCLRYHVLSKMGWGHFSTVWLAWDRQAKRPAVLKVQKSAQRYAEAAKDEVTLLKQVAGLTRASELPLVLLLDHFQHRGVNGTHQVMVFEPLGATLLQLIKQTDYRGLPFAVVRTIARCIFEALDHLHRELSIIHTDLKPENVLATLTPAQLDELVMQAEAELHSTAGRREAAASSTDGGGDVVGEDGPKLSKNQKKRLKETAKRQQAAVQGAGAGCESEAGAQGHGAGGGVANGVGDPDGLDPAVVAGSDGAREEEGGEDAGVAGEASGSRAEPRLRQQRKPEAALDPSLLSFKVVDLGNACWRHRHFTEDIQTRQYRCPEVITGAGYDTSADIWSAACVLFEAATGEVLFNPRSGSTWTRDDDHLAMFLELLGPMPKRLTAVGKFAKKFFNRAGELRSIRNLKYWDLQSILISKYDYDKRVAAPFTEFLLPMLAFEPLRRPTAGELLRAQWLQSTDDGVDVPPLATSVQAATGPCAASAVADAQAGEAAPLTSVCSESSGGATPTPAASLGGDELAASVAAVSLEEEAADDASHVVPPPPPPPTQQQPPPPPPPTPPPKSNGKEVVLAAYLY